MRIHFCARSFCGQVHLIIRQKNPVSNHYEEHQLLQVDNKASAPEPPFDRLVHIYTLIIKPDNRWATGGMNEKEVEAGWMCPGCLSLLLDARWDLDLECQVQIAKKYLYDVHDWRKVRPGPQSYPSTLQFPVIHLT